MALKLSQNSMILTSEITNILDLKGENILIIQHWVKDTIDFWLNLQDNSKANVIFLPKPYSQNKKDLNYWIEKGLNIINPWLDYENWLEKDWYIEELIKEFHDKSLIIIEVWWIIAEKIIKENKKIDFIKWIVEITTFWHNRHIKARTNLKIPTYSVARSEIKQEESRHVWYAVYASLHKVLNELDRPLNDCNVSMVWYWMIWENVCNAFAWVNSLSVYDIDDSKLEKADKDWYKITNDLTNSDIVIASTWFRSINWDFIKNLKDWVLLVSAWSRQNEIDVDFLEKNTSEDVKIIHEFIKRYVINWKEIFLFRDWKNANFAFKSCPANSMDLLHAEVLTCVSNIIEWNFEIWTEKLNEISKKDRTNLIKQHKKLWD